ncbi:MAG: J domain-containing protein [Bacteroidota bacterium]
MALINYYELLGVEETADLNTIKKAFREAIVPCHPENDPSSEAAERFNTLIEGFDILSDNEKRKAYDKMLHAPKVNTTLVLQPQQEEQYQEWQKEAKTKSKRYSGFGLDEFLLLDLLLVSDDLIEGLLSGAGDLFDGLSDGLGDVFDLF